MIRFEEITLAYQKQTVLENVNLCIEKGKITTLLGPNGSGKTTLLSSINGIVKPVNGEIYINGIDVLKLKTRELSRIIATVPQLYNGSFNFTVYDMILLGRSPHIGYLPKKKDKDKADEVIELIGIGHLRNKQLNRLSGGERQLVMIARAIAQETEIMLLDEPTSYLDLKNQLKVLSLVKYINQTQNVTCVMTLHDPNQALMYSDNIVMFNKGKIQTGNLKEMITVEQILDVYGVEAEVVNISEKKYVIPKQEYRFG